MNISITGTLGSGKSSVCKIFEEKGREIISNGVLFRNIAAERGVSVVELNKLAETDKSIDKMLDDRSIKLGKEKDNAVFDARMGWHFVPHSFKVFLLVDVNEAARRVYNDNRVSESYESVDEAKEVLLKRQLLERERYTSLYKVEYLNLANYNLVIESTSAAPDVVASTILSEAKKYEENIAEGNDTKTILLNPTSLHPTKSESEYANETADSVKAALYGNSFCIVEGHNIWKKALDNKDVYLSVELVDEVVTPVDDVKKDSVYLSFCDD